MFVVLAKIVVGRMPIQLYVYTPMAAETSAKQ